MNRKVAKLIRQLSDITGKSEKSMKKEYYRLFDKDRFLFKKQASKILENSDTYLLMTKGSEALKRGRRLKHINEDTL